MRGYRLELLAQVTVTRRYVFEFSARAGVRVHLPSLRNIPVDARRFGRASLAPDDAAIVEK